MIDLQTNATAMYFFLHLKYLLYDFSLIGDNTNH